MTTTKEDIVKWLKMAKEEGNISYVIIVCDTYDWNDYPVNVKVGQDIEKIMKKYNGINMQKIMEIYNLDMDIEQQLSEHRAYHPYASSTESSR